MLLTYYGSPVCAKYSVISAGAIRFISNWKKQNVKTSQGPQIHLGPQGVKTLKTGVMMLKILFSFKLH